MDPANPMLYLQLLDLETSRSPPDESAVEAIFEEIQANSEVNDVSKAMFAQRRVTFVEEFGSDINKLVKKRLKQKKIFKCMPFFVFRLVNARLLLARVKSLAGKKRTSIDDSSEGYK